MTSPSTDRLFGANSSVAVKAPCVVATTAAITLSAEQTIDGVAVVDGDRVLVKNQTDGTENGIYIADSSSWERAPDCDGTRDLVSGTLVYVTGGTVGAGFYYVTTTGEITVGTTSLTFAAASSVLAVVSAFMQTLLDDTTAAAGRTTLGVGSGDSPAFTGLTVNGVTVRGIVSVAEQATTSGTSKDFTGIPSGVKRITIMFNGVSTNGTSNWLIQLGDAGGVEATGYVSNGIVLLDSAGVGGTASTAGFLLRVGAATVIASGQVILNLEDASDFTWTASGSIVDSASGALFLTSGRKATSAELDRVRITTVNGTDAFDAGAISISYE